MVRIKKSKIIILILLLIVFYIFYLHLSVLKSQDAQPAKPKKRVSSYLEDLSKIAIVIVEFENFDNDVVGTCISALSSCQHQCKVFVVSDDYVYPPLDLPKGAQHVILKTEIMKSAPNVKQMLAFSTFIFFLPDGARISSASQLRDQIRLLQSADFHMVALGIGGPPLACHTYALDLRAWTLTITPAPQSEACDGVSGRAALLTRTEHVTNLTFPLVRPSILALSLQGTARKWKTHVGRGAVLGEGRALYTTDHLQWKRQTLEDERLRNLYSRLGIKKVVEASRRVQWYGCTRTTPRCFPTVVDDTPAYLYRGRWTPPCCLEGLRATARHVFGALHACRVRWWLEGGSLLGAARSGDIIPWDADVDVGIYASDLDRCPQLKSSRWQTLEDAQGFVWQKSPQGGFYQVAYSTANHLHVDIFPFESRDGMMVRNGAWETGHHQDTDFPEHFLRPLSSIAFAGVTANAPNNLRDFLEFKFGEGVIENPQLPNIQILSSMNVSNALL